MIVLLKKLVGYTQVKNVTLGNNIFVGAGSIIMQGVSIFDNVIIGAGSVVSKSLDANAVYAGNPARYIIDIHSYTKKVKEHMKCNNVYDYTYTLEQNLSYEMKNEIMDNIKINGVVFIE